MERKPIGIVYSTDGADLHGWDIETELQIDVAPQCVRRKHGLTWRNL